MLHQISGCENAERTADVVFVHGLGGDGFATWRHGADEESSWPHWLGQDFPQVGVWSFGYAASASKWPRLWGGRDAGRGMALPDRARQALDLMVQRGVGERPLFFICHSLGGLVVKQILRMSADAVEARWKDVFRETRAVLFLATPHAGSDLASLLHAFRTIFGATITLEGLRAHDAHLSELLDWYRNHAVGIQTKTYFESRDVKGVTIVKRAFAHPGVGADPVPLDEDHISIAKPRERDAQVCGAARDLLREVVLRPRPREAEAVSPDRERSAVPHELPPPAEEFFGRRRELEQLIERLRAGRNTAVVGLAGLGKTALAANALAAVVGAPGARADSPFPDGVVYLDLYRFHGEAEAAWDTLADKLAGPHFMERSVARERAEGACQNRRVLVIVEGGEEADGAGRGGMQELLSVVSPQNRWLLLTRLHTQADAAESVKLYETLDREDAGRLLDTLTKERVSGKLRERLLDLLAGHPLALTWAGNLIAREDERPERLVEEWEAENLAGLADPKEATHTLEWLFRRSAQGLDDTARRILEAAGLLAAAPFPLAAIDAALPERSEKERKQALRSLVQSSLLRLAKEEDHWEFTHVLGYRIARRETGSDRDVRTQLGQWLHAEFQGALTADALRGAPLSLTRALEHLAALLRSDDDQALWRPLVYSTLYEFSDRLTDLGRLALVKMALGAVEGWLERFPREKAQEPYWIRERSVLLNLQGDVLRDQGDLRGAIEAFRESLQVRQRLADSDSSNAEWRRRDLSVSHDKVGDVLREQGDLPGALEAFQKSLQVRQRLADSDPSNGEWRRNLSVSQNKVGDVLREQGDLSGALEAFRKSLQVIEKLADSDPSNAVWQRDLSVSQERMGDVLRKQGDLPGALEAFRRSLQVSERLADSDPSHAGWQRDVSVSLTRIAEILDRQGDRAEALRHALASLSIGELLAALDATNVTWQRDVMVSRALVERLRS